MVVTIQRPITYVSYSLEGMKQYIIYRHFYRAMRMYSADYAVERCLSVCLSHAGILSKGINISSTFSYHPNFSVPNGMAIYRRGPP